MAAIVWGLEASPFLLKLEATLRARGQPFRRLPLEGGRLENLATAVRLTWAIRTGRATRHPGMDRDLDEYPAVPFYSENGREFLYDSSSLGRLFDTREKDPHRRLFPADPRLAFVAQLIDEAFDEYGLYMVHHMRWVGSATDTAMPEHSAAEISRLLGTSVQPLLRRHLARRQVRRCPYLFSVAPPGFTAPVERARVPPSRAGFPPTHALLHESWCAYLDAMESLLATQPWILGERFSIADASAYGQLSMNLIDPSAERELRERAPATRRWLEDIRTGRHAGTGSSPEAQLGLSDALGPLLGIVMRTFAPLMVQNEKAWHAARNRGETLFNEAAFDRDRALYDGELLGHPFRSVAKTFQVRIWQDLRAAWRALDDDDQRALRALLPNAALFDDSSAAPPSA